MGGRRVMTLMAAVALAGAAGGFTLASGSRAGAAGECSAETIQGTYALYGTGIAFGAQWAANGRFTFDGAGRSSGTAIESYNGIVDDGVLDGTYSVAPDCRGRAVYTMKHYARSNGQPQAHHYRHEVHTVDIVVAQGGDRIFWVLADTYAEAAPRGTPEAADPTIAVNGFLDRM